MDDLIKSAPTKLLPSSDHSAAAETTEPRPSIDEVISSKRV